MRPLQKNLIGFLSSFILASKFNCPSQKEKRYGSAIACRLAQSDAAKDHYKRTNIATAAAEAAATATTTATSTTTVESNARSRRQRKFQDKGMKEMRYLLAIEPKLTGFKICKLKLLLVAPYQCLHEEAVL